MQFYWVPAKINNEFVDRLLKIEKFRHHLDKYMADNLVDEAREELKKKGMKFLFKFYLVIKEMDLDIFRATVSNHMFSRKCKSPWTINEVSMIIESMRKRMRMFEWEAVVLISVILNFTL